MNSNNILKDQVSLQSKSPAISPTLNLKEQISLKKQGDIVIVKLPAQTKNKPPNYWQRIINNFKIRLRKIDRSWQKGTKAQIDSQDSLLDTRQLNELENILEQVGLKVELIVTRRRQTAVAAASAGYSVKQESSVHQSADLAQEMIQDLAEPLYLKTTIRSGVEICHPSSVIVVGDVNPGATIFAHGDVLVWGSLKGVAHAGGNGDRKALIMALKMQPTQLRIADLVARAPEHPAEEEMAAELAYISEEGIKIHVAANFYRYYDFNFAEKCWMAKAQAQFKL